jgi:putative ABC transport system permease protein
MGAAGALLGLGAWYALLPRIRTLFEGIGDAGALLPLAIIMIVGAASLIATLLPALRATRVDPLLALKTD